MSDLSTYSCYFLWPATGPFWRCFYTRVLRTAWLVESHHGKGWGENLLKCRASWEGLILDKFFDFSFKTSLIKLQLFKINWGSSTTSAILEVRALRSRICRLLAGSRSRSCWTVAGGRLSWWWCTAARSFPNYEAEPYINPKLWG